MQTNHSKDFFVFTKKEKRGIIAILILILFIFLAAEFLYPIMVKDEAVPVAEIDSAMALLKQKPVDSTERSYTAYQKGERHYSSYKKYDDAPVNRQLFYFDPNTLDAAGWQRLGVREKTALTIQKYISKGGKFRSPEDINKIWGLREDDKKALIPYVRIAEKALPAFSKNESNKSYERKAYEKKLISPVDINTADSAALIALPGIGPGYSRRIINFRNKLGGFYRPEQVAETFGLPDSVFQKIKPYLRISGDVKKININTASAEELRSHPYIRWQLANIISAYKKQHGNFKNADDLRKVMGIDEEAVEKMLPYLIF